MKTVVGLPRASRIGAEPVDSLTLVFEEEPPLLTVTDYMEAYRRYYREAATRTVDAVLHHTPGGFVDALLGELLYRKSSVFRVTGPEGRMVLFRDAYLVAARDVCMYCAGRAPSYEPARGPNEAQNWTHRRLDGGNGVDQRDVLCMASAIFSHHRGLFPETMVRP